MPRSQGRGGRGQRSGGRGRSGRGGRSNYKPSKQLNDYQYYLGSAKQASDYTTTTKFVFNHIKKTLQYGDDIVNAIHNEEEFDFNPHEPQLSPTTATTDPEKERQTRQHDMKYKEDYAQFSKRKTMCNTNKIKAYAIIWERCTTGMKQSIESLKDFESKIQDNPIELLQAIKQHSHNYQEHKYEMAIITDAIKTLFNLKQKDKESLIDYTRRFKTSMDVLSSYLGGPIVLTKHLNNNSTYTSPYTSQTDKTRMTKEAHEKLMAYLYLDNAGRTKYGSLLTTLKTQKSLDNNQYPSTIASATQVLNNHRFDNAKDKNNNNNNDTTNPEDRPALSLAQVQRSEGKCHVCGSDNHWSNTCPIKETTPKNQWFIRTGIPLNTQGTTNTNTTEDRQIVPFRQGSSGALIHIKEGVNCTQYINELKDLIILDTGSSEDIFCNPKYGSSIKSNLQELKLHSNGGTMSTQQTMETISGIPGTTVWYNDQAITNIHSFAELEKNYDITYDSGKEQSFLIYNKGDRSKPVAKYTKDNHGLYVLDMSITGVSNPVINSIEENKMFYTNRQIDRAKAARDLYHAIGSPSIQDYRTVIRTNQIKNCPITTVDIDIAERIFGTDIGTLKGKGKETKPSHIPEDYVKIPQELYESQQAITLCVDGMYVNGIPFLTTVSRRIIYRTAQRLQTQKSECLLQCIKNVAQIYKSGNFTIARIHVDNEFRSLLDPIRSELQAEVHYTNKDEHVPEIENCNKVIKERVRSDYHRLPYKHLPLVMLEILVMQSASNLNLFIPKGGASNQYSPYTILNRRTLDYNKHLQVSFGTYGIAYDRPKHKNSMESRGMDAIYLRSSGSDQGGHDVMNLATGRLNHRRRFHPSPITPQVIDTVHKLAALGHMPPGLKLTTRTGNILYDSALIAGVDYDQNFQHYIPEEDDEDKDYEYQEQREYNLQEDLYEEIDQDELADILQDTQRHVTFDEDHDDHPIHTEEDDQEDSVQEQEVEQPAPPQRPRRTPKPIDRLNLSQYTDQDDSMVIAIILHQYHEILNTCSKTEYNFVQTYSIKQAIRKFGDTGKEAAVDEIKQLHGRGVFKPIHPNDITPSEKKKVMGSHTFVVEKRDGRKKGRTVADGSTQRSYVDKDDAASPTASTEAVLLTGVIDAKEGRDVMTADIPNAFVQTDVEATKSGDRIIMKLKGHIVEYLEEIDPMLYRDNIVHEKGVKTLYVVVLKAIYGMMQASLWFYRKLMKDLKQIGFIQNPYDPCTANRTVNGKQHTVVWHVDDLKSSHVDSSVNDKFLQWLEKTYANDEIGKVKAVRGDRHDYLAMILDYSTPGELMVDMANYVKGIIEEFPYTIKQQKYPWNEKLFIVGDTTSIDDGRKEVFHTYTAKVLFASKRSRPDVSPAISYLSTRVQDPNEDDWKKLTKMIGFLKSTVNDCLHISAGNIDSARWSIDAAYGVHADMKSHTGATMSLGKGAIQSISTKQKINSRSSTEAELIAVDDALSKVMWTKLFLESQGYHLQGSIIYQDNQSTMKLEANGKASSSKRTRHFNIKYFYITDLIQRGEVQVQYCPTEEMVSDYMTKPLQGEKFMKFRRAIMGL